MLTCLLINLEVDNTPNKIKHYRKKKKKNKIKCMKGLKKSNIYIYSNVLNYTAFIYL